MSNEHTGHQFTSSGIPQPYHLVRPSIWPLVGAMAGGTFVTGMILYMHGILPESMKYAGIVAGVALILITMFMWWKDMIHEAVVERAHSPIAAIGLRYGMALFIASEVMFFVAFFWAFFDGALFPHEANQYLRLEYTKGMWPPPQFETIAPFGLPLLMTMILLLSGCTVTWAHHEIIENNRGAIIKGLGITCLLGLVFLAFQGFEYHHAEFHFKDGLYPSTFFMATGFHGFHVFVGTVFLIVCWLRAKAGQFTPDRHFGFEA
ncbi:MAG: Cytochrome c oxidase subunit 3, partial [Micavibrio sp.]|nr:Cytochrome c oxidase subunit 3 [Micavibrio sp.]